METYSAPIASPDLVRPLESSPSTPCDSEPDSTDDVETVADFRMSFSSSTECSPLHLHALSRTGVVSLPLCRIRSCARQILTNPFFFAYDLRTRFRRRWSPFHDRIIDTGAREDGPSSRGARNENEEEIHPPRTATPSQAASPSEETTSRAGARGPTSG